MRVPGILHGTSTALGRALVFFSGDLWPSATRTKVRFLFLAMVWCGLSVRVGALDPLLPPSGNFDFSHWKLTLPDATASEVWPDQMQRGFTNAYFQTGPDGAMVFWCPVTGGTTANSSYPRSELRELLDPTNNAVNWTGIGTHILEAQCAVNQLPSSDKVIIGQIHGYNVAYLVNPLVKLIYNDGEIYALVHRDTLGSSEDKLTFPEVALHGRIDYEIRVVDGVVYVTVAGITRFHNFYATGPWATESLYFKAGSYCQDNSGSVTEGSKVSFYALRLSHPTSTPGAPAIATQPLTQTAVAGRSATLSVVANGLGPLSYAWRFNGTNEIPNATNASLTFSRIQTNDAGNYSVVVSNAVLAVTSTVATISVKLPPSIVRQPESLTVIEGGNATFSVAAEGSPPLSYRWWRNGSRISGATASTYTRANVQSSHAGDYTVVVTGYESVTSRVATLTVLVPPSINTAPKNQAVLQGTNVTFSVSATGSAPLAFQWSFQGTPLAGATANTCSRTNVQTSDSGDYSVVISNLAGMKTASASLTVTPPPPALLPPGPPLDGRCEIGVFGQAGTNYVIQVATNLSPANWISIHTNKAPFSFMDPEAHLYRQRFYRAFWAP